MSKLRLTGSTSGFTELTAPAVAGSNTLTLPTGNGTAGQFLQTNGSGALSFAAAGKTDTPFYVRAVASIQTGSDPGVGLTPLGVSLEPSHISNQKLE